MEPSAKSARPDADDHFLSHALSLARSGIAVASPNPCVGAVVVGHDGAIAGEGFHSYEDIKHAEVIALERAADRARGATLYLNLEPCSHHGRTGPCADAVIAAGVQRVVCSLQDPNPLVAGKGFARLRAAGIKVDVGGMAEPAYLLNEAWCKYVVSKLPFITLKCAMTLDGKIAVSDDVGSTNRGETRTNWISGETARNFVQELRHQSDAILTGIGTAITDDPMLTDRSKLSRRRPLFRVVLDSRMRLPLNSRLVQSAAGDVLVFTTSADAGRRRALEQHGVRVEQVPAGHDDRVTIADVLRRLGELEITSVLVEGGTHINTAFLGSHQVDKLILFLAPRIAGDGGTEFAAGLIQPQELKFANVRRFGEDIAVEAYPT
jgi:diaminohydroxyphosphoribosylaminopyrimidine deaminase/5-amino-6-(5-phosphoribosylamino)uracil reductase